MSFGKRLLELRKSRGISQEKLAKMLGTKGPAIGRYERDVALPALETIIKLAEALNVSIDYLLGVVDEEIEPKNLDRLAAIQRLPKDIQEKIFYFLDMSIRDAHAKQAYS
ncbi:helix-turn-helix transcriptional regulator [Aureispira sp. CCB-E]|uniref:helix-turn-helix domain-containing protein n=1 Tax=Aureispira sp. CCB-E TaxID=3051121 RepID=UPI002868862F|nr:helix-turn-helix transcriptional regulator [Aureispira sp. CCB-E]WMX16438.1 helix-turn-helix transcriptional regulator [Aureispira sp. CCB-E]